MSSASQNTNLEDRLRSLILDNAQKTSKSEPVTRVETARYIPPHLRTASVADQEAYARNVDEKKNVQKEPSQTLHGDKKRFDQYEVGSQGRPQQYHGLHKARNVSSKHPDMGQDASKPQLYASPISVLSASSLQMPIQMQQRPPSVMTHREQVHRQDHGANGTLKPSSAHQQDHSNHPSPQISNQLRGPPTSQTRQLYQPGPYRTQRQTQSTRFDPEEVARQARFLETLVISVVPEIIMSNGEKMEKEKFRVIIEQICRDAIVAHEKFELRNAKFHPQFIELKCFGSMNSGFATKGSDMDLALLTSYMQPSPASSESPIPRLLEKKLLEMGYGARLLTKTRVPIIKLCEKPTATLMLDLLEERNKWENDVRSGEEAKDDERKDYTTTKPAVEKYKRSSADFNHEKISSFEQKAKQSLGDYCSSARRLLQEVGGRDSAFAHSKALTDEEQTILNSVCKAFVTGLSDKSLRNSLFASKTLSFAKIDPARNQRSLEGVIAQAFGEQLNLAWHKRPLQDSNKLSDTANASLMKKWGALLNKTDMDVLTYNRVLTETLTRMRKIPTLQLFYLEQGSNEDPVAYHAKVVKILEDIKIADKVENKDDGHIFEVVVAYYIAGVRPDKIRKALTEMTSNIEKLSLQHVLIRHRVLQLANDYEYALEKKIYVENDRAAIEKYISLLRNGSLIPISQVPPTSSQNTYLTDSMKSLIKKIRCLPDPIKARDKYRDHLQFPKATVGIQCDINFSADLGLQNTLLLRCYSLCDPRVKQLVLFVKHWAKVRCINTPYTGTLSSYGYVLMVLHYLINIALPYVLPNLQTYRREAPPQHATSEIAAQSTCKGHDVRFWRNEEEIALLAKQGILNCNHDSVGELLRGFYVYYAQSGPMGNGCKGFDWGREVLSLRTKGGLLTKAEKDWTCAKSVIEKTTEICPVGRSKYSSNGGTILIADAIPGPFQKVTIKEEFKEIRHRYLFAIEDPFELDHNVARTVNHNGIVSIRDEFRRAWRIIKNVGKQVEKNEEGLLDPNMAENKSNWEDLMRILHGNVGVPDPEGQAPTV